MKLDKVLRKIVEDFHGIDDFKKETLEKIKNNLDEKYNIPSGVVDSFLIRDIDELMEEEDIRLIGLFVKEFLEAVDNNNLLESVFTRAELNELEQYYYRADSSSISLPLEMFPALKLNATTHSVKMTAKMVAELLDNQILNYGYEIQREAKLVKRKGNIIKEPRVNQKNVDEMTELLVKGQLMDSTIYLNAAPRTSDEGDELVMDEKNHKLTITKGTRLDVLDGFHRCLASHQAYQLDPNIEFYFNVIVSNYTTKEAQRWQAQHAKAMPWSQHRVRELQKENRSDKVVAGLRANPDIGDYISTSRRLSSNQIVNFSTISDAVDRYFKLENRRDEVDTIEVLTSYIDDLVQYDGVQWGTDRRNNLLISRVGIYLILYYISLNKEKEYSTVDFYSFLDRLVERKRDILRETGADDFSKLILNNQNLQKLEKIVKEVT